MESNLRLILDEITGLNRRFDVQEASLNRRFSDLERSLSKRFAAVDFRFDNMEASHAAASIDLLAASRIWRQPRRIHRSLRSRAASPRSKPTTPTATPNSPPASRSWSPCAAFPSREEVASSPSKLFCSGDWSSPFKSLPAVKTPLPLPPLPKMEKAPVPAVQASAATSSTDSTLKAVKAYRRALGLCFKCRGKWSKDHRCSPEVLLAVEAIWQDFQDDDDCSPEDSGPECSEEQVFLAISKAALQSSTPTRAIQFNGLVERCPVRILIDSGSSASFVSLSVSEQLSAVSVLAAPTQVEVVGGGILHSPGLLTDIEWSVDQCVFRSNFRVLQLSAYDVIIGMDWLQKWLVIPYQGQSVLLQGLNSVSPLHLYLSFVLCKILSPPSHFLMMFLWRFGSCSISFITCLKHLLSCPHHVPVITVFHLFRGLSQYLQDHTGILRVSKMR
ncbi:unnamed protein product [Miscanthus lutarioriparius]|uniref:Uncharacterized protein n=1 Tax=Miscanthus lutarioriparius TaxID=422564 RepID=A0A811Q772_9POAL|nr:unnamed protein product [Miscanthus lutarioriparius]